MKGLKVRKKKINFFIEEELTAKVSVLLIQNTIKKIKNTNSKNNNRPNYVISKKSEINTYRPQYKICDKEAEIDKLEKVIPLMAQKIFQKAYADSVLHGNNVIKVIDNIIYEIYADGRRKKIKEIEPLVKMNMNKKIILG